MRAVPMPLSSRIRELREARGLSQEALARAAGLSSSVIARLEQGRIRDPGWHTVQVLADALGCSLDQLRDSPPSSSPE